MKVLLLEPPPLYEYGNLRSKGTFGNFKTDIRWTPVDLIVIAGALRKNGIAVSIIDAGGERLKDRNLYDRLLKEASGVNIVIVNTSTTTINYDVRVASLVKDAVKGAMVGLIGVHVMALPEDTLKMDERLDFVVYCEPEPPIIELAKKMDLTAAKGIAYRQNGSIKRNAPSEPVKNMDDLGIPAHDLVPFNIYREPQSKRFPMSVTMVSRGCVNKCVYCSACFFNGYRLRSVENVLDELEWINKKLGIKELKFIDDGINYSRQWLIRLLEGMSKRGIDITWNANVRADFLDYELALLMKRAGCHTLNIGIETGEQNILDNINKNLTIELIKDRINEIKDAGLEWQAYFMLGLPGETKETMQKSLDFALELDPDLVTFNIATPHPGTAFYYYLKENNYLKDVNWSFYDTNSLPVYDYPDLNSRDIYAFSLKAYRKFYFRPAYIIKRIRRITSLREFDNMLSNFYAFTKNFVFKGNARLLLGNFTSWARSLWNGRIFNNFLTYRLGRFIFSFNYLVLQKNVLREMLGALADNALILEVGSGTCENAKIYKDKRIVFSDINPDYLSSAKKYYGKDEGMGFFCSDGGALCFKSGAFDMVVMIGFFHHVDDETARMIIKEGKRVLKKGGKILVIDGLRSNSFGFLNIIGRTLCALDRGKHFKKYESYRSFLENSGIKILEGSKKQAFPYEVAVFKCLKHEDIG